MPPKRGRRKKNVDLDPELSPEEHFSDDELYDPPDEAEIVFEETTTRPQKLRLSDVNTSNLRLNKVDVRRYVQACNYSWVDFMRRNGVSDSLKKLVEERQFEYEVVSDLFSALPHLANSESLDLYQTKIKPSQLSHLNSNTKIANHMERQVKEDPPDQEPLRLKFLECREIQYPTDTKKPDAYFGSGLDAYCKELWNNKEATAYNDKELQAPSSALMMNIGAPISAIAICPNADELGNELLALSAFPDEEWLTPDEDVNSYVQFYSYNPHDFNLAECRFLLEIPSQIVLDLKFCPNFVNIPGNPEAIDESSDFLGLLAASTTKGLVLIYRISKKFPEKVNGKVPVISLKPAITLRHPEIQIKIRNSEGDSQEIASSSRVPIFSMDWPPNNGGNLILATSEARRVMIWDLNQTPEPREMTEEVYLQLSDTLLLPKLTLFEASWQSPPNTVCFLNENELVIAFRNRTILVYKVPECEVCLTESTPKSAGVLVTAAPATFRSFLSADATLANIDGILYAQTCFISLKEAGYEVTLIPSLNSHQLQIFDVKLCPRTGLCVSCGADGRLQHAVNARNHPREVNSDLVVDNLNFLTGRPIIQLIRHRKIKGVADVAEKQPPKKAKNKKKEAEKEEEEKPKVLIKNEHVREGNWMEIRCGDTSLIDLAQLKKHRTQIAQTLLDRRIESLTRVAISTRTAGLTAVGGEAGLVFVLPILL